MVSQQYNKLKNIFSKSLQQNSTLYNKVQLTHYLKVNELFERNITQNLIKTQKKKFN